MAPIIPISMFPVIFRHQPEKREMSNYDLGGERKSDRVRACVRVCTCVCACVRVRILLRMSAWG